MEIGLKKKHFIMTLNASIDARDEINFSFGKLDFIFTSDSKNQGRQAKHEIIRLSYVGKITPSAFN